MHATATRWTAAAAVAAAMLLGNAASLSGQGGGSGGGNQDPPIVQYRKLIMQNNRNHRSQLQLLLAGNSGVQDDIKRHTAALEANVMTFSSLFPEGSAHANSRALPDIWTKKDEFATRVRAIQDAAKALNAAAQQGDNAAVQTALRAYSQTCGACHTSFRRPAG